MSASTAPTQIVNLALDILKTEQISDVDMPFGDPIAGVMDRWYDDTLEDALESFPWSFASKRAAIPLNATAPAFGYSDAYRIPNDFLSLNFIEDETLPLSQWLYTIEGLDLLTDNGGAASLNIGYVWKNRQVATYPASFRIYLAHLLAYNTVTKLVGMTGAADKVLKRLQKAELEAKAKNGRSNPPRAYRKSYMLSARRYQSENQLGT